VHVIGKGFKKKLVNLGKKRRPPSVKRSLRSTKKRQSRKKGYGVETSREILDGRGRLSTQKRNFSGDEGGSHTTVH